MKATTLQNRIKKHLTLKDGKTLAVKYECVIGMLLLAYNIYIIKQYNTNNNN